MARIYTIGETLLDILFQDEHPVAATPGGSMLNTAVSLGRLGLPVYLVSEFGRDRTGNFIGKFLKDNGVNQDYTYCYEDGKTALALAFLNEQFEAEYTFYKQYPRVRLRINYPGFTKDDIVLFGSFYALVPEIRQHIIPMIESAHKSGALIIYDPNIRSPHREEVSGLRVAISEHFSIADIVRGSDEDFNTIYGINDHIDAYKIIKKSGCQCLIYTKNKDGVHLVCNDLNSFFEVPAIVPASTVGAGDSFNAGLIYAIFNNKIRRQHINGITSDSWIPIIKEGIRFAEQVCLSTENYISVEYARIIKAEN